MAIKIEICLYATAIATFLDRLETYHPRATTRVISS